jgi:hypothetical protein
MVLLLKLLNRHGSTNFSSRQSGAIPHISDWPLHCYKCTVLRLVHFLSNHSNNVCMFPVFEYHIKFCILLHSETKESSNGSSGSCQGDGTKTNSNESMPVCQRPSSSLSLQSISSEFSFRKMQLITYSKPSFWIQSLLQWNPHSCLFWDFLIYWKTLN